MICREADSPPRPCSLVACVTPSTTPAPAPTAGPALRVSSRRTRSVSDYPAEDSHLPLFGPPNVDKFRAREDAPGLLKALEYQKHWRVRRDAAEALGQIGDARAVGPLIAALRDDISSVRQAAAEALGQIGDTSAVEPLIAALRDASLGVRRAAADALGQIGDRRALEPLVAALREASLGLGPVRGGLIPPLHGLRLAARSVPPRVSLAVPWC